ncbi:hypothetical protein FACS189460_2320 [Deltaproteobacteria bacterium]|nr:hypothetical protein FACS189460_2320 [Deltaproteobacteria bacterium]
MPKAPLKIAVLLVWLFFMGWWWQQSRTWPVPEKIEAAFIPDHYDLFAVRFQGQKVGWAFKSLKRFPNGAYQAAQGLRIQVDIWGRELEIQAEVSANLSPSLDLGSFNYTFGSAPVTAIERGRVADGRLAVQVNLGEYGPLVTDLVAEHRALLGRYAEMLDFSREILVEAPAGPGLASLLGPYLSYLGLKPGAGYTLTVLDPVTRSLMPLGVRVEAESRQYDPEMAGEAVAFLVRVGPPEAGAGLWLDRFGRTLKEEALGFTLLPVDDQAEARRDITPLKPPAALLNLADRETLTGLANRLLTGRQPKQGGNTDD